MSIKHTLSALATVAVVLVGELDGTFFNDAGDGFLHRALASVLARGTSAMAQTLGNGSDPRQCHVQRFLR